MSSMMRKYVPDLLIMTRDTDPDLRFMALNDLEKEMTNINNVGNINNSQIQTYSKILIKCLNDEFSEVRTQSLKSFQILPSILRADIVSIIQQLLINDKRKISITSTINTMAIHNILKNLPNDKNIHYSVIETIMPKLLNNSIQDIQIDEIEILNDLVEYNGKFMSKEQISNLLNFLIDIYFYADSIISKKSILAIHVLIGKIDNKNENLFIIKLFFDKLLNNYNNYLQKEKTQSKIKLLVILSACITGNPILLNSRTSQIWNIAIDCLNINQSDIVDEDYEVQQNIDTIRYESIILMVKLFENCDNDSIESLLNYCLSMCPLLINYDPYNDNDANDEDDVGSFDNDDEDDDYSEYEQDDDDDDDDNCSWKIRYETLNLLIVIIKHFPIKLSTLFKYNFNILMDSLLKEKNKFVKIMLLETLSLVFANSSQDGIYYNLLNSKSMAETTTGRRNSDVSMQSDDDPYSILINNNAKLCQFIYQFVENNGDTIGNENVNVVIKLLTNLTNALEVLNTNYTEKFVVKINQLWKSTLKESGVTTFYLTLLKYESIDSLGNGFQYIVEYIESCLSNDLNNKSITDGLSLINLIYKNNLKLNNPSINQLSERFTDVLIEKSLNSNLSTNIRLSSIDSLVILCCNLKLSSSTSEKVLFMFANIITSEVLALTSLDSIRKLIESNLIVESMTSDWVKQILLNCLEYVHIAELNSSAIKLIKLFALSNLVDEYEGRLILNSIEKLHTEKKFNSSNCADIGEIMNKILSFVNITDNLDIIISMIIDLITFDNFDDISPFLMKQLLQQTSDENISTIIHKFGDITDLKISKILAVLSVASGNEFSIGTVIENLNNNKDVYFSLVFLNEVSKSIDINIGIDIFLKELISNQANIVNISIKILSTIISKYPAKYLDEFLNKLIQTANTSDCLKVLSNVLEIIELNNEQAMRIFNVIIQVQLSTPVKISNESSYENASICFGILIVKYDLLDAALEYLVNNTITNEILLASIGNSIKYSSNDEKFIENLSLRQSVKYSELSVEKFIFHKNLFFKQIAVSNFNLILNKLPNIAISLMSKIIPGIMESEIKPNKDYIHTQFIGPYKHKIDDGLSYRKQLFESIYYYFKILEENRNYLLLGSIKWEMYFNKYFDCGVKDDESIVSVCLLTTLKLFEQDGQFFMKDNGEIDTFDGFFSRCRKTINKKIADNAVKQDIEKQNNMIKMIIRFLKKVNILVENKQLLLNAAQINDWNSLITETKAKYPIFDQEE